MLDAVIGLALIPMITVLVMSMPIVDVVDVVPVGHRDMAAVRSVHVGVNGLGAMVVDR